MTLFLLDDYLDLCYTRQEGVNSMGELSKRIYNLLSVKSIVTLILTVVFAYQSVTNTISQDFMTVYAVVIAFYFGTQSNKQPTGIEQ